MDDATDGRSRLRVGDREVDWYPLAGIEGVGDLAHLPMTVKVLLEGMVRHAGRGHIRSEDIAALARWPETPPDTEVTFHPSRVLMQDFTGVPAIADLAALRDAVAERGGDPAAVEPLVPVDLVIDHSISVEVAGRPDAVQRNRDIDQQRNEERYAFLKWGQQAFRRLSVLPPNTGICHQVNLEHLARVVGIDDDGVAHPDTLVGTDSHTTMVNGLGVLGWGVGGIEAEAAMLGEPITMSAPRVIGVHLDGELRPGVLATDLVLHVTEQFRRHGVVGAFLEVHGPALARLNVEARATISNMSPEFGSTAVLFPVDDEVLAYLRRTGRDPEHVALVEAYAREQGLWPDPSAVPCFVETITIDLADVEPNMAGPARPQDRVPTTDLRHRFRQSLAEQRERAGKGPLAVIRRPGVPPQAASSGADEDCSPVDEMSAESFPASDPPTPMADGDPHTAAADDAPPGGRGPDDGVPLDRIEDARGDDTFELADGHVVIAAITSCTNTSNPAVMVAAGLLARNARRRALTTKPWVKASLAPGSQVVADYLARADLLEPLAELGFDVVGYGCTTCIGNSGPLDPEISAAVHEAELSVASVLSGNRNFEGRINPDVRMNFLASPPLVVAAALAGTVDVNLADDPIGTDADGSPVTLADVWPADDEIAAVIADVTGADLYARRYGPEAQAGDDAWQALPVPPGGTFVWDDTSTYLRRPPFVEGLTADPPALTDIVGARVLALLGDSVTTDHISPAGAIKPDSPAGRWLQDQGITPDDFNSYGARRGNHEVMVRGTFANIRLRNQLVAPKEGGWTRHQPSGDEVTIYDAAERYCAEAVPLVVIAGKEYGTGSSRDWAAKGTLLLGVRAVIAESYERIHRSNLVGMGVLPLQFTEGDSAASLGLDGSEAITIRGLDGASLPRTVTVEADDTRFEATVRIDTPAEADVFRQGGILPAVVRRVAGRA